MNGEVEDFIGGEVFDYGDDYMQVRKRTREDTLKEKRGIFD